MLTGELRVGVMLPAPQNALVRENLPDGLLVVIKGTYRLNSDFVEVAKYERELFELGWTVHKNYVQDLGPL